jgi:uridine kinase
MLSPLLIGICGGTGSGKTTLAQKIITVFGEKRAMLIDTDSYYRDRSHIPLHERHHFNFDHPDALDIPLLIKHVQLLQKGQPIEKQVYDFTAHTRKRETVRIEPGEIVVVDGILIFAIEELCRLFDLRIFIDEAADIRLLRRIARDVQERGRTVASVAQQYLETVRPMHLKHIEPSKEKADIILKPGDNWQIVIAAIRELQTTRRPGTH